MKINLYKLISRQPTKANSVENPIIGSVIKWERKQKNMTLEEGSEGICSTSYLSKVENNQITPSSTILKKLKKRLDLEDVLDYDLERFQDCMKMIIDALVKEKSLAQMYEQLYLNRKDQKSRLVLFGYYVTNEKYDQAAALYPYLEEEIDKFDLLEINLFYFLTAKVLARQGRYVQAIKVLNLADYLKDYPELELLIKVELVLLKLKTGKYFTIRHELEHLKSKLLNAKWHKRFRMIEISILFQAFEEVDYDYVEAQIKNMKNYPKRYIKTLLFAAVVFYNKEYRNISDFESLAQKDFIVYLLYLLYLDQKGMDLEFDKFVSKPNKLKENPVIKELIFFITHKRKLDPGAFLRYIRTLENGIYEYYNGVVFIKFIFERTADIFEKQKYYKTANKIRKSSSKIIKTLKTAEV